MEVVRLVDDLMNPKYHRIGPDLQDQADEGRDLQDEADEVQALNRSTSQTARKSWALRHAKQPLISEEGVVVGRPVIINVTRPDFQCLVAVTMVIL